MTDGLDAGDAVVSTAASENAPDEPEAIPLLAPADGVPDVAVTAEEILAAAELLVSGHGPFAIDAERASGFRYSNRAYLLQIRRAGAGSVLIDPVNHGEDPLMVMAPLADVLDTRPTRTCHALPSWAWSHRACTTPSWAAGSPVSTG
jgi:ribonuclease D